MSFARRILVVALVIQILGFIREIVFSLGLEEYVATLSGFSDPTLVVVTAVFVVAVGLLRAISRGNRWATLATIPLEATLLVAVLPPLTALFVVPSVTNFATWFTITAIAVAALVGIPFAVVATLESFGRRAPASAVRIRGGFAGTVLFVAGMIGSVLGMTVLAVAVAAAPREASEIAISGPPDEAVMVTLHDLRFDPAPILLSTGRTAVFVTNDDGFAHAFDVDELDLHVPVAAGETVLVMVDAPAAGTLRLYCGIPGHAEGGMVADLIVG